MEPLGATTVFLVICVSCLLFLSAWRKTPRKGKLPPGPVAFPIIGNMLQLTKTNLPQHVLELSRTYGPIFTIYLGSERVVVLHGYEILKETLIGLADEFSARGRMPLFEKMATESGIVFSNGERWKQLRRFILTSLRNFGMGKKSIEERILEETRFLMERLRNTHGRPFDPTLFLTHAVSNIICSIIFGDRFDYEDQKFVTLINIIEENVNLQRSRWTALYNFFPTVMDYVPGPHHKLFKNAEKFRKFVLERVNMHKPSLDPNCPRDFIDAFLIKMQEEQKNDQSNFSMGSLLRSTVELFSAGTGTTSVTLLFGLLILLKYPEIEEKVHKEIDRVIGRSRSPCMADRSQMPYTDAVIHEIQRYINLVPLSLPHAVTRDVHIRQYLIPKDTTIFPALNSVLYDSKEFPNPEQFKPEHFLDENGAFKKSDYFVPFSAGKRICVGEGLARMELFLILTVILQNFTLKPVVDLKDIDITPVTTFVSNGPKSYQLCVLPR
ncbi:cytochrome P450 2H2-like [Pelodiscus sinensis]|uniref:unspecific monooxygenase n=1 Tax=Pelodiscus sinensis TaxID=13735 RepID=K7FLL5_PELSI|nr:cytochrome P450 2H2-like [Pelodiscus sinensis]|eukprot:XP_006116271.1 cytochrome P450 2H2-like [Pelodiscus sinensis]